jgi:Uma2 family endonuclease
MASEPKRKYTLEEYLNLERESEIRYEFLSGEIFAMSGGSFAHDQVLSNVHTLASVQLADTKCSVRSANMQIKVPAAPPYRYADGSVVCGKPEIEEFNGSALLVNPIVIWEILSPSTEAYDRGDKFTAYKSIQSLREYLLIAQHRPSISHYVKQEGELWTYREYDNLDDVIQLISVDCTLALSDVYRDVEFKPQAQGLKSID